MDTDQTQEEQENQAEGLDTSQEENLPKNEVSVFFIMNIFKTTPSLLLTSFFVGGSLDAAGQALFMDWAWRQ